MFVILLLHKIIDFVAHVKRLMLFYNINFRVPSDLDRTVQIQNRPNLKVPFDRLAHGRYVDFG